MKLGILSDSHGRRDRVRQAVRILQEAGAEAFIHCGDLDDVEVLEEFVGLRMWFVFGNMDPVRPIWRPLVEGLALPWPDSTVELQLAGKRVAVFHGHERAFPVALQEAPYDYLLHGHTHRRVDYRVGTMRVINPGALHRVSIPTVALLDVRADTVEFIEIRDEAR
jgi:uncharacterized protein